MSSLSEQYKKQWHWRDWDAALSLCPVESGHAVLDLGCGTGDIAKEFVRRGAHVTGIDGKDELLKVAKETCPEAEFYKQDLRSIKLARKFDGIWSSFSAAYMSDFDEVLDDWISLLKPSGWICLVEATGLFNHTPMTEEDEKAIEQFYAFSTQANRYDYKLGDKLPDLLEEREFSVITVNLRDDELSFQGPAPSEIQTAWEYRMDRMAGLQNHFRQDFPAFRERFLKTLADQNHKSNCRVVCSVGVRD